VKPLFSYGTTSQLLAAGLLALPVALAAQTASPTQEADWRRANDAVGALKRGHADVLKWEQANVRCSHQRRQAAPWVLPSPPQRRRFAWPGRCTAIWPVPLARLGPKNEQLIAEGRWTELDPSLQRRVEDAGEVLEVAAARAQSLD
jgi:hypothetical protein